MKDRNNYEYDELIVMQQADLRGWAKILRSEIYTLVAQYVRRHNLQAPTTNDKHTVWRGQDVIEILRTWPEPEKSGYPPIKEEAVVEEKQGAAFI